METTKGKRIRAANWDMSDKILLRELIEEKISIIENKCVDTNTSRQKREAWKEVLLSFNTISATPRDTAQLQAQWRGMKLKAKSTASAYKKSLVATGGGAKPKSPDLEDERLMALIPHEFEEGVNEYDCDAEMNQRNTTDNQMNDGSETSIEYENIEVLGSFSTPPPQPSPLPAASVPKEKQQSKKRKTDDHYKRKVFEMAIQNRRAESKCLKLEHEEKIKTIRMEREEKLKTLQMERAERKLTLELERQHKEEMHQLQIKMMQEAANCSL